MPFWWRGVLFSPLHPQWDFGWLLMKGPVLCSGGHLLSDAPFLPAVGVEVRVGGEGLEAQEGEVGQPLGYNHLCIAASVLNQQETLKIHLSYEH